MCQSRCQTYNATMCGGTYQEVIELQVTMKDLVLVQEEHCSCCIQGKTKFEIEVNWFRRFQNDLIMVLGYVIST
jgi:hypothetical protein